MYVDKMKGKGSLFAFEVELQGAYDDEETKAELRDPETDDPYFIKFRELSGDEFRELMDAGDDKQLALLETKFTDCMLEHNMRNTDRTLASKEDVVAALRQYGTLFYYVLTEWQNSIPLLKRSAERSQESPGTRSKAGA